MRSATSFFEPTLYRKTLTRFWPLWAVNLAVWMFALPFNGLMQLRDDPYGSSRSILRFARNVGGTVMPLGMIFALLAGLVAAMAVCSHLYNARSANFMGALPVRREGTFLSTYLAGLTMLIAPNAVVFLLTLLVEAAGGALLTAPLLFWLAAMCAMEFFFFSFAVFLGQFTGHVLMLPVFYGVFNALAVGIYGLANWVLNAYYFGFDRVSNFWNTLVQWLTPVWTLSEISISVTKENGVWFTDIQGLWIAGIYALAAVVFTVCALLLARRRQLENAGDVVAVKVMRPVFKYGVSACAGLFIGLIMYEMFGFTQLGLMLAVILWGIVGYFVAQMLLDKTVRVFGKWKGAAIVTAAFLVLFAAIAIDFTGYESRVPAVDEVVSVTIRGPQSYPYDSGSSIDATLTDPEDIADVIALHRAIVKYGEDGEPYSGDEDGLVSYWNSVNVTYTLRSGAVMRRSYNVLFGSELHALAGTLMEKDSVRRQAYGLDYVEVWLEQGAQLEAVTIYREGESREGREVWGEDARKLWDAVMSDFESGDIGIHNPYASEKIGWYTFQTQWPDEDGILYGWELEFRWRKKLTDKETEDAEPGGAEYLYRQFTVLDCSTRTRAAMEPLWQKAPQE